MESRAGVGPQSAVRIPQSLDDVHRQRTLLHAARRRREYGSGGGKFSEPGELARAVASLWPTSVDSPSRRFVVCTGGEPLLQLDAPLVEALHHNGFEVAVETNGTQVPPPGLDWLC